MTNWTSHVALWEETMIIKVDRIYPFFVSLISWTLCPNFDVVLLLLWFCSFFFTLKGHSWNVTFLGGKYYLVDVMHDPTELYPEGWVLEDKESNRGRVWQREVKEKSARWGKEKMQKKGGREDTLFMVGIFFCRSEQATNYQRISRVNSRIANVGGMGGSSVR